MSITKRLMNDAKAVMYHVADAFEDPVTMSQLEADQQADTVKRMKVHLREIRGNMRSLEEELEDLRMKRTQALLRADVAKEEGSETDEARYRAEARTLGEKISSLQDLANSMAGYDIKGAAKLRTEEDKLTAARDTRDAIEAQDTYTRLVRASNKMSEKSFDIDDDMSRLKRKMNRKMYGEEAYYDLLNKSTVDAARDGHYDREIHRRAAEINRYHSEQENNEDVTEN